MFNVNKDDPGSNTFDLFIHTAIMTQKYADSTFYRKAGFSYIKYFVLKTLSDSENPVTPSDISRLALKARHDITTLVDRMKRDSLVDVVPSETDKRSVNIVLTEKGLEKLQQAEPVVEEITQKVLVGVTGKMNMAALTKSLAILRDNAMAGLDELSRK